MTANVIDIATRASISTQRMEGGDRRTAAPVLPNGYSVWGDADTDGTPTWRVDLADSDGVVHESWSFSERWAAVAFVARRRAAHHE